MKAETKRWTAEEDDILRKGALTGNQVREIARQVRRTESAVRARAYFLKVVLRSPGVRRRSQSTAS